MRKRHSHKYRPSQETLPLLVVLVPVPARRLLASFIVVVLVLVVLVLVVLVLLVLLVLVLLVLAQIYPPVRHI